MPPGFEVATSIQARKAFEGAIPATVAGIALIFIIPKSKARPSTIGQVAA